MAEADCEESSGNVFADLGFRPKEAEELTARSTLTLAMKGVMTDCALTQAQAAIACGTDQPTLSEVLRGRMDNVSLDRLAHWLRALELTAQRGTDR